MSPVTVVSDSTHYLPPALAAAEGIEVVSLYVNEGGATARESEITDVGAFFARLRAAEQMPTTSQPSIGDFLAVFAPILERGDDVVSVHLAGGISGTVDSARQAAAEAERQHPGRRVLVLDSDTSCGGLGFVALAAAAAARGGGDADQVLARAVAAKDALDIRFAIDTLEYLRRGGRIGSAQAWLGGALKIKPILTLKGAITPVERVRTSGRAFERMVGYASELRDAGQDRWVVQHIQAEEQAAKMVERCHEVFGSEPLYVSEVGPVIGAHVGPGLLGVGALPASLLTEELSTAR